MRSHLRTRLAGASLSVLLMASIVTAQTKITPPKNKYSVEEDVQLGRDAAAQARQQLPIMRDDEVTSYVEDIGRRLSAAIRPDLRHSNFRYTFDVVNVREINAFALPGGPMFVNRGMLEAAKTEGEIAGVMAHEISHVTLRHGTAQASAATKYQIGTVAGAILGAIIGGNVGSVVAQGTQFGLGTAFMRFGREYERQADIEGVQLMARAGYDPRDMANMFKTIEKQGGGGGPEWLSDHPNPSNRYEYITKEAQSLRVDNPIRATREFDDLRAHLRSMPQAPTTEQAVRNAGRGGTNEPRGTSGVGTVRVEPPSTRYQQYEEGDAFRVSVPSNWKELPGSSAVTFAPEGAYGSYNGQGVFTHGVEIGISRNESHDLETATDELIDSLAQGNPRMSRPAGYRRTTLGGRQALQTTMGNVSEATGERETIQLVTAITPQGDLIYFVAVAPQSEFSGYRTAFQRVWNSIRFI
jgi:Zn-dependent protease with chaperone function